MIKLLILLSAIALIGINGAYAEYDTTPSWKQESADLKFRTAMSQDNVSSYEKQMAKIKATEDFKDRYDWLWAIHQKDLWNL